MKTLIVSINSKYIHSSLAAWYLKVCCGEECGHVKVLEFTVNENADHILSSIYAEKADVAAFSCYIWNIETVIRLSQWLKGVTPGIKIVLGGPEVSFECDKLLEKFPFVDYIIPGEGEYAFSSLLKIINTGARLLDDSYGIACRTGSNIFYNNIYNLVEDLDCIPSPYTREMLDSIGNRLVYFESSRGCPFSCSYCISSTFEGVRYFSLERVKQQLKLLMDTGIPMVKFVDRTFNCNRARAKEIFRYIIDNPSGTSFHFEAAADLFDDEMLQLLTDIPEGLIQLEIGVQTTNGKTLEAINRRTDINKVFHNVERLRSKGNIHLHLDLIAGLPFEDHDSFKQSFYEVYRLNPHNLQLGFLKLLKGSKIRSEAAQFGYVFKEQPPYEMMSNSFIDFDGILELKKIEELLDRYCNSGRFAKTLGYAACFLFKSPYDFYRELMCYMEKAGFYNRSVSNKELYSLITTFLKSIVSSEEIPLIKDLLKFDYLASDSSGSLPEGLQEEPDAGFRKKSFDFLTDEKNIRDYLPGFLGTPAKQIYKSVYLGLFNHDLTSYAEPGVYTRNKTVILFDYSKRNRVTGLYGFRKIDAGQFK